MTPPPSHDPASTPPPDELCDLLESYSEPHILCDRNYRILAANAAYRARWVGAGTVIGRTCYEVSHHYAVPCDQAGESCPLQNSLRSGQRERVLHLHHTRLGEQLETIELTPIRHRDGAVVYYIERIEALPGRRNEDHAQGLIGRSPAFLAMMELVARVAPAEASVLLQGESGTGKELVANAIHQLSRRAARPFIAVDCSGLTETLFESELFGHERGAFTGAVSRKIGLVEAAAGGTLFLDEVGDIPLAIQVKLLRLLETGTFRRVGSTELRHADIRVISATHRPLEEMVRDGRFRQDLFYRLNIFPIPLPPLRARPEDILLLAEHLLQRLAGNRRLSLRPEAQAWLCRYSFPGNVRELRNLLERACLLCDGEAIDLCHLPGAHESVPVSPPSREGARLLARLSPPLSPPLSPFPAPVPPTPGDTELIEALQHFSGNRQALARHLGLSERTLYRRIKNLSQNGKG